MPIDLASLTPEERRAYDLHRQAVVDGYEEAETRREEKARKLKEEADAAEATRKAEEAAAAEEKRKKDEAEAAAKKKGLKPFFV